MIAKKGLLLYVILILSFCSYGQLTTPASRKVDYKIADQNIIRKDYDKAISETIHIHYKDSIANDSLKIAYDLVRLSELSRITNNIEASSHYLLKAYQYNLNEDVYTSKILKNEFANLAISTGAIKLGLEYKIELNRTDTNNNTKFYDAGLIGSLLIKLNKPQKAFPYFQIQKEIASSENNFFYKVQALNNLGFYHQVMQDIDTAINQYQKIIALHSDSTNTAFINTCGNLGVCYHNLKKYYEAIQYLNINFEERYALKDYEQINSLGVSLYDCYLHTNQPDKAAKILIIIKDNYQQATVASQIATSSYFLLQEDKKGFSFYDYSQLILKRNLDLNNEKIIQYDIVSSLLEEIANQKESNIKKTKKAIESSLMISRRNNFIISLTSIIAVSFLLFLVIVWILKKKNVETKNLLIIEKNNHLASQLELKKKNVQEFAININMRRELSNKLMEQLEEIKFDSQDRTIEQINAVKKELRNFNNSTKSIEDISKNIELISQEFYSRLEGLHPNLTKYEKELCSYLKLGMTNKEISHLINISPSSVRTSKSRLKKKLSIDMDIYQYLKSL